jgi:hypothetical protein
MDSERERLLQFTPDPTLFEPQTEHLDDWYRGDHFDVYPKKSQLRTRAADRVLRGWKPQAPIISEQTRVLALGSCFASHFTAWLGDNGFNRRGDASPYNMLLRYGAAFETVAVVAQQFRWAFEGLGSAEPLWVSPDREQVRATEERRTLVRETVQQSDVLILTLGLSELWYDRQTGEPLWRAIPKSLFDPERYGFKVLSVSDTVACLTEIERIRARHAPGLKIIYTVSPIRLRATFRPVSAITANSVSKAVVRAGLDEFLRGRPDLVGTTCFYFPSYELVTEVFRDPWLDDNRHIHESVVQQVLELFAATYTSLPVHPQAGALENLHLADRQLMLQLVDLEARNLELQHICDERQRVIDELDKAAKERLALVERLDALCREYQQQLALASR